MKISKIHCSNLKSFDTIDVEMSGFNVIVGMNGSGKSNFILLLKIAKDILGGSLAQAISNLGGAERLRNFYLPGENKIIEYGFALDLSGGEVEFLRGENEIRVTKIDEEFAFRDCDGSFELSGETLRFDFVIDGHALTLTAVRDADVYKYSFENPGDEEFFCEVFDDFADFTAAKYRKSDILLHAFCEKLLQFSLRKSAVAQISVYEFEQELLSDFKEFHSMQEDDSSHVIFFRLLYRVLNNEARRNEFYNLLHYVLPDIEDVKFEGTSDDMKFTVKERFSPRYIDATLLSDGTIFLIVMILALYFDDKKITIFDEPERRIHPHLLSKVIDMMKDAADRKQIILSTHNAEIVKYSGPKNIILIHRNSRGNSCFTKPGENAEINTFLENDIGLDELFVQNMLK